MSTLSDLLTSRLPEGWSGRRVAREASRRGLNLSPASANNYLNGRHGEPSEAILEAFAAVLTIPIEALRASADLPHGSGPYSPPAEAARLSRRQRLAVDELIRSIVTAQEVGNEASQSWPEAGGAPEQPPPPITLQQRGAQVRAEIGIDPVTDPRFVPEDGSPVSERGDTSTDGKRDPKGESRGA